MRKNVRKVIDRILSLLEEAESYEFHKQNLINSAGTLFREYQEGKYTHAEYDRLLADTLKRKTEKEWISYYDSYIYSLLKQIEPLISHLIYYVYNDHSIKHLNISPGVPEHEAAREKSPVIEEDTKHELRKIREKSIEDFIEVETEPLIGRPRSALKERFQQDITEARGIREKQKRIEVNLPEPAGKKLSFFRRLFMDLEHSREKRSLEKRKKEISAHLEKFRRPTFYMRLQRLIGRVPSIEKKPKPVRVRQPFFSGIIDAASSWLKPREKLELREMPQKPSGKKVPAKTRASKTLAAGAGKDRSFSKLISTLDSINRSMTELKVSEPKISLRMKIDLLIIRLHTGFKHKKVLAKGKIPAGEIPEEPAEIRVKIPEKVEAPEAARKAALLDRMRRPFIPAFSYLKTAASRINAYLFVPVEKPSVRPAARIKVKEKPAAAEKEGFFNIISGKVQAALSDLSRRIRPVPGAQVPAQKPAAPEIAKPQIMFRFSWSAIKESYQKMMEREKRFVSKKDELTPSLQMQVMKEKIRAISEEEKITPRLLREEVESIQKILAEKKKFKIYQPSFIGSFANATIRRVTFYLIERYPSFFKTLYDNLRLANIAILSNTYVNIMLLTTIVVTALSSVFFFAFFIFTNNPFFLVLPKTLLMAIITGGITFLMFYTYPQMKFRTRERSINTNLPFAINHIAAVAGSGVAPTKMFRLIMESEEYGEIVVEIEKIVEYVELFGYDLLTAIRSVALTSPSTSFKEFLEGMVSTIESGGDLNVYLREKTSEAMLSYDLERQKYTEVISTYSDVYTGILIAAPLFFIVALSLVSMLGGTIGGLQVNTVIVGGAYIVIPFLNILFLIILELTQPEV